MTLPVDHPLAGPAAPSPCAAALAEIRTAGYDVPNVIDGRDVPTGRTMPIVLPHAHSVQLGQVHCVSAEHVGAATQSATKAAHWWGRLDWEERAAPFMTEELFAPVVAAYVYDDTGWDDTIRLVDESTAYGLTGAIFGADEDALAQADDALRYTAGNFYINDKPTGPVVGQQPFGGARASGTNDKVGTVWNLIRFASPRAVKRNNRVMRRSDS